MLDLDSIVEGRGGGAVLRPAQQRGLNYEGYLLLLLFFENQDTKLIRVMDLIQLNMQGNYDQGFRLSGCFGGFDISAELVRRKGFLGAAGRRTGTFFLTEVYFPEEVDR